MDTLLFIKDHIIPLLITLFLAYIAYQQLATNQRKLQFDLYTRRFSVYTTALKFYQELIDQGVTHETHLEFIEKKESAKFLFSSDTTIYELLNEMHEKSFKVRAFKANREQLEKTANFDGYAKDSLEVVQWAEHAINMLSKKVEPYLNM